MDFITSAEAAEKWGLTTSRVLKLAQSGRIPGAKRLGYRWMIPKYAEKPADARTRSGKFEKAVETDGFRYPGYEYRSLSSFSPPLNEEELIIKAATEAAYACRFNEAKRLLGNLAGKTGNRYIRINALYTGCMIDIFLCDAPHFIEQYERLTAELEEDFPHKVEMMEYIYLIKATLGEDKYYSREFRIIHDYDYHESFLPRLANLSAVYLSMAGGNPTIAEIKAHELNCILLQNSEAYADLVPLHLYLGIAYSRLGKSEEQNYHIRKALMLAEKYEIYYCITDSYYNMRMLFKQVITEFPEAFRMRIEKLSEHLHRQLISFMEEQSISNIYKLLYRGDYIFLYYAVHGLTNKEIADRLQISVGAVGKRYGVIYAALGVGDKHELVERYNKMIGGE